MSRRRIPVAQYDLDGNFVAFFPSQSIAAEATGIVVSQINKAAHGTIPFAGESRFILTEDVPSDANVVGTNLTTGEVYAFANTKLAYQVLGVRANDIKRVLAGKRNSAGGYVWQ